MERGDVPRWTPEQLAAILATASNYEDDPHQKVVFREASNALNRLQLAEDALKDAEILLGHEWRQSVKAVNGDPVAAKEHRIADLVARLAQAEDALAKTDKARLEAAGMEEEIKELENEILDKAHMIDSQARELKQQAEQIERLVGVLERIAKWHGEFPDTGRTWGDGSPMSYGTAFGSNGERDFMRQLANNTLASLHKNQT